MIVISVVRFANQFIGALGNFPNHEFRVEIYTFGEIKTKQFSNSSFFVTSFEVKYLRFFWLLIFENNKKFNKIHQNTIFPNSPMAVSFCHFSGGVKRSYLRMRSFVVKRTMRWKSSRCQLGPTFFSHFCSGERHVFFFRRNGGLRLSR